MTGQKLAIFDFDHTLVAGDSFWPFLEYASGCAATYAALAEGLARFALHRAQGGQGGGREEMRTFLKAFLLRRLIAGKNQETIVAAAARTRLWQKMNAPVMHELREHHEKGHKILIASGGLDLYLPELLRDVPHDALICTDIGMQNGVATGEMIHGNCVRLRKAERVGEWMAANGPFDESWGYGNYPHDVPMLTLVKHRIIV
ncbi:MAG: HAD-IB family hydrolase [Alphaproteobacteria bacterium]|nr:HAD-IB family hydrolase [Alphaproteobacteria bacterium]